jgi:hypothetical protein
VRYAVTKRPGEPAKLVEITTRTIPSDIIKDAVDRAWFTVTQARICGQILDLWCDDEGLLKDLPLNFFHPQIQQPIVGPIIVCGHDEEGDSIPIGPELADAVVSWLNTVSGL